MNAAKLTPVLNVGEFLGTLDADRFLRALNADRFLRALNANRFLGSGKLLGADVPVGLGLLAEAVFFAV